eukprot:5620018-Alexandrium_andersonii.AAC.1
MLSQCMNCAQDDSGAASPPSTDCSARLNNTNDAVLSSFGSTPRWSVSMRSTAAIASHVAATLSAHCSSTLSAHTAPLDNEAATEGSSLASSSA